MGKGKYPFKITLELDEKGRRIKFEGEDEVKNAIMMATSRILNDLAGKCIKAIEGRLKRLPEKK